MVTVRERVRIFTPELQLRTRTGQGYNSASEAEARVGRPRPSSEKCSRHFPTIAVNNQENHLQLRQRGRQPERRRPHRLRHSLRQRPGLRPTPLATALARRRQWRCAKHQQRCSQHACRALIHDRSQCPTPLRAGLLGPRVVSPHPQGLQGSHLNLSQTSAQRHRTYFLLNNKAVKDLPWVCLSHPH